MKKLLLIAFGFLLHFSTVQAQNIDIQTRNIGHRVLPSNAIRVPFLEVQVTPEEAIAIKSITVQQTGLSNNEDIDSVRAFIGFQRSLQGNVDNDGIAHIRFLRPVTIPAGQTETITVTAQLDSRNGRTIGFNLIDVETVAPSVSGSQSRNTIGKQRSFRGSRSFTTSRNVGTSSSSHLSRTSNFQVPNLVFKALGANQVRLRFGVNRIGRFRVQNPDRKDATLDRVTLKNIGTADLDDVLTNLQLTDQFNNVVATPISVGQKEVTFQFEPSYQIDGGNTRIFSIWGDIVRPRQGETIQFVLDESNDLEARIDNFPTGSSNARSRSGGGRSFSFGGSGSGNVQLSRTNSLNRAPSNRSFNPGARDVIFLTQNVRHKAPILLDTVRAFVASGSFISDKNGNGINNEIEDLEETFTELQLFIDGQLIDRNPTIGSDNNGNLFLEFEANQAIFTTAQFIVSGRIGSSAVNGDRMRLTITPSRSFPDYELLR